MGGGEEERSRSGSGAALAQHINDVNADIDGFDRACLDPAPDMQAMTSDSFMNVPQMREKVAKKEGVIRDRKVLLHQQKDLRWEVRNGGRCRGGCAPETGTFLQKRDWGLCSIRSGK